MHSPLRLPLALAAALMTFAGAAQAAAPDCSGTRGCAAKFCNIEREISFAQQHQDSRREARLRIALAEANASCTDDSLRAERQADITSKEQKLKAREAELAEARLKGKTDKISKAQRKLEEAQAELKQAEDELQR